MHYLSFLPLQNRLFKPQNTRQLPAYSLTLLTLSLLCFTLVACDSNKATTATTPTTSTTQNDTQKVAVVNPSLVVETVQPQDAVWSKTLAASGDITAWEVASAGPEEMGLTIRNVLVREGDWVKKNQILATFSNTSVRAQAAQAKAGLAEAQAAAADAKANAQRMKKLVETGFMSPVQYNGYQTAAETAQARVAAAQAMVKQQNIRLNNTTLRAPVSGLIAGSNAVAGALTTAGQSLFTIIRDGRLEWRAQVTAEQLAQITPGMQANVTLPGDTSTTGTVRTSSPTINARTRNATVYVDLPADSAAKMGMFASGSFSASNTKVLTLPQSAIVFRDGFSNVVEVLDDNTVQMLRIENMGQQADSVAVSGVKRNSRYVLRGGAFLNNGDTVRVVERNEQLDSQPAPTTTPPIASE